MARLTEEMVIARSRVSDLACVKKLNCWGAELADVSVLRRMLKLEVLSISVNKITSLADFQNCKCLRELYVRNNGIRTLNEICYLQDLPALRVLWLAENPCAKEEGYRLTVLKTLPNLEKLDDVVVQPEEVEDAQRKGRILVHPDEMDTLDPIYVRQSYSPPKMIQPQYSDPDAYIQEEDRIRRPVRRSSESPIVPAKQAYQPPAEDYDDDRYRNYQQRRPSDLGYEPAPPAAPVTERSSPVCEKCSSPLTPQTVEDEWATPPCNGNTPNGETNHTNHSTNDSVETQSKGRYSDYRRRGSTSSSNGSGRSRSRAGSPQSRRMPEDEGPPHSSYRNGKNPASPPRRRRDGEERVKSTIEEFINASLLDRLRYITPFRDNEPRRPNHNLVTAMIVLMTELDYEGLEQVERVARRLKDEISCDYHGL